jgi:excisionase family DNA binding protein
LKADLTLPPELVDLIADKVIEKMKPILSSNGKKEYQFTILDKEDLAHYLGVEVSWLDKKVSANEIPYFKVGKYVRFKKSVIDKWIEAHTVKPFQPFGLNKNGR